MKPLLSDIIKLLKIIFVDHHNDATELDIIIRLYTYFTTNFTVTKVDAGKCGISELLIKSEFPWYIGNIFNERRC